jgi:hypothetical protein
LARGKSTVDVEVNLSAFSSLVELAEKYKTVLEETNKLLKENYQFTKRVSDTQREINRTVSERRKSSNDEPTWVKQDRGPTVERDPKSGQFRPYSGQSWRWGPGKDNTGSGQFKAGWAAPPPKGSLSDLDRLPWGPGKDNTGSGQFKAEWIKASKTFERFDKNNQRWNEQFYQMFASGRIGQNFLRNMFSGNFLKMLGVGATGGLAAYAIETLAQAGATQRLQALSIGGDVGKMKAAQIELARFGPVDPGLQGANLAKRMVGPQFAAYHFMGFTNEEIQKMDPSDLYAQLLVRAQQKLKGYTPQAMGNLFNAQNLGTILPGGIDQATALVKMPDQETKQAAEAVKNASQFLTVSGKSLEALTNLNASLNLAGGRIQTILVEQLGQVAPVITNFLNSFSHVYHDPVTGKPIELPEQKEFFPSIKKWFWGSEPSPELHSPVNNPPLESTIYGSAAVGESDGGVFGGMTRVGIFTPKIEKLNRQVIDTTKSLDEFSRKLLSTANIFVSTSGAPSIMRDRGTATGGGGIGRSGLGPGSGGAGGGASYGGPSGGTAGTVPSGGVGRGGLGPGSSGAGGGAGSGTIADSSGGGGLPTFNGLGSGQNAGNLPVGVRNNNPLNISMNDPISKKYGATQGGWDVNHYGAAFKDMDTGLKAGMEWVKRKYASGQHSVTDLVAKTWPASGYGTERTKQIAGNIARSMGVDPNEDLHLDNPANMEKWVKALTLQEQGPAGARFVFGGKSDPRVSSSTGVTGGGQPPGVTQGGGTALKAITDQSGRAFKETGSITLPAEGGGTHTYNFVTGGGGRGSAPTGEYKIDEFMQGGSLGDRWTLSQVGQSHDTAWDPDINAQRSLLRIHQAHGQGTLGCIGILGGSKVYADFEHDLLHVMHQNGGKTTLRLGSAEAQSVMGKMDKSPSSASISRGSVASAPHRPITATPKVAAALHDRSLASGYGKSGRQKISSEEMGRFLELHQDNPAVWEGRKNFGDSAFHGLGFGKGYDEQYDNVGGFNPWHAQPWGHLNPMKRDPMQGETPYAPVPRDREGYKLQEQQARLMTKPHIGDMSQYAMNHGVKLHVNNPAGMDIVAQTAMLGSAQGNFG